MEISVFTSSPIRIDAGARQDLALSVQNRVKSFGLYDGGRMYGYDRLVEVSTPSDSRVTAVQNYAFNGCAQLSSADLPSVVKAGRGAFQGCSRLKSVQLGDVAELPDECFKDCTSFERGAWQGVKTAGAECFANTAVRAVSLPDVSSIGDRCFQGCLDLDAVYLTSQESVDLGGADAFAGANAGYVVSVRNESYRDFYAKDAVWKAISSHISSVTRPVVTFRDSKSAQVYKVEVLNYNMDGTPPSAPEKTGHTFSGWDGNYTYVTTTRDCNANWTVNRYRLDLSASPPYAGQVSGGGVYDYGTTHGISAYYALGYKFSRWSDNNTSPFRQYTIAATDALLSAHFLPIQYTVSFDPGATGATGSKDDVQCAYDSTYSGRLHNLPPTDGYEKTGYAFARWRAADGRTYLSSDDIWKWATADGQVVTLSADWTPRVYSVTLNGNGGTVSPTDRISAEYDGVYSDLARRTAARDGYTFGKWTDSAGSTVTQSTKVTTASDHGLTANWNGNTYTPAIAGGDGGTAGSCPAYTVSPAQQTKTITLPTKSNHHINGWSASGYGGSSAPSIPVGSAVLTIPANCWKAFTMTPSWAVDGYSQYAYTTNPAMGSANVNGQSPRAFVDFGSRATWTAVPVAGYRFTGWSGSLTSTSNPYVVDSVSRSYALSASFQVRTYGITTSGSNCRVTSPASGSTGTFLQPLAISWQPDSAAGYTYALDSVKVYSGTSTAGTVLSSFTAGTGGTFTMSSFYENVHIYGSYTRTGITYTVSYNGNGATSGSTQAQSAQYPNQVQLRSNGFARQYTVSYDANGGTVDPSSSTASYQFAQWNTSSAGTGTGYSAGASYSSTTASNTLYAKWTPTSVTLADPSWTGHTFGGWWSQKSGGSKYGDAGSSYTPSQNLTAYAQWTANTIQVAFDGNGSTGGSMDSQAFTYDVPQALSPNKFIRRYTVSFNSNGGSSTPSPLTADYSFYKWSSAASSGAYNYDDKQVVKNPNESTGGSTALYATWTPAAVTLPSVPKTGYTPKGWYSSAEPGAVKYGDFGSSYTPIQNLTAYAQWNPNTYNVAFDGNGSSGGSTAGMACTYDVEATLTQNGFWKTGSRFTGWAETSSGEVAFADQAKVKNLASEQGATKTLYARWENNVLTLMRDGRCAEIHYKVNGATEWSSTTDEYIQLNVTPGTTWYAYAVGEPGCTPVHGGGNPASGTMGAEDDYFEFEAELTEYYATYHTNY